MHPPGVLLYSRQGPERNECACSTSNLDKMRLKIKPRSEGRAHELHVRVYRNRLHADAGIASAGEDLPEGKCAHEREGACIKEHDAVRERIRLCKMLEQTLHDQALLTSRISVGSVRMWTSVVGEPTKLDWTRSSIGRRVHHQIGAGLVCACELDKKVRTI